MWASLGAEFDATLIALKVDTSEKRTARLPPEIGVVWIPARFEARWPYRFLLRPAEIAIIWKHLRAADAFLTFMPEIGGIYPLCLALLARRRRYICQISTSPHFRSWGADGTLLSLFSRFIVNVLAAISTQVFVVGPDLKKEFVPPLHRKVVEVLLSTLMGDVFHEPAAGDPSRVKLLTVARLVRNKRVDIPIHTTRVLLDRGIDAHLVLLGEGPLESELLGLAAALELGSNFQFAGQIDDPERLGRYYADSDILLLSSETEGVSLVVLEAMAAGTPVITTAAGGLRTFLSHGRDSIVVPRPDATAFADAVEALLSDPDSYLRIAKAAQEKVRPLSNIAWAQHLERTIRRDVAPRN